MSEPCGLSSGVLALRELGAQVRGQGSQSYRERGSVSHVSQTPTTIELSISAPSEVVFNLILNPAARGYFSTIFFNINMINLSLSRLYCNTSSLVWPSHALIPLPWWRRGCTVGDQGGWGLYA